MNKRHTVLLRLSFFIFLCSFLMLGAQKQGLAQSQDQKMIIGGLVAPPYIILDEDRQLTGIFVDMLRHSLNELGIEPVFEINNWARSFDNAKNGRIDGLIPTIKSDDREIYFNFPTEPLTHLNMSLMKRKNAQISFDGDLKKLNNYSIGRIRNARVSPDFDRAAELGLFRLVERTSFSLLAKGVARNRIDLMAGDELMGLWGAANSGVLNAIDALHPPLGQAPVYLAISKKSPFANRSEEISQALKMAKSSMPFKESLQAYEKFLRKDLMDHLMRVISEK